MMKLRSLNKHSKPERELSDLHQMEMEIKTLNLGKGKEEALVLLEITNRNNSRG